MTGRERVLAMLSGNQPDCLPLMPITMMFAADCAGVRYGDYARDHRLLAAAQIKTAEEFDFDYVSAISDPAREAADYGATIQWFDDQPPAIVEEDALLADQCAFSRVKPIDLSSGRTYDRILGVELLREQVGADKVVEGWVEGPCAEAADLRGINRLMTDFYDDPSFIRELFEFLTDSAIRFAAAQVQAGADIIGVGDAAASLSGPRIYDEFIWAYEKKLIDGIHAAGGVARLHICGNTKRILAGMGRTGADLIDLDFPSPMHLAREQMGTRQVLSANLHPVNVMRDGNPRSIAEALASCHTAAGNRFVVAAGCEIPRGTPPQNLHAMRDYAHRAAV